MARKLRIEYPGAIYHIMSRGDHGEDIFRCDPDRESFLQTLGQACEKTDWQVHAWCLMRNHFHLVVETPKPNLGEHGIQQDSPAGRAEFEKAMEARRLAEEGADPEAELPGWCIGSQAFRQELLEQMRHRAGPEHYGPEVRESAEEKANRIVAEELRSLGWREADLAERPKGHPEKVRIAARLRADTTMTLAWVAGRLRMGTRTHLAHLLYWRARGGKPRADGGSRA